MSINGGGAVTYLEQLDEGREEEEAADRQHHQVGLLLLVVRAQGGQSGWLAKAQHAHMYTGDRRKVRAMARVW